MITMILRCMRIELHISSEGFFLFFSPEGEMSIRELVRLGYKRLFFLSLHLFMKGFFAC